MDGYEKRTYSVPVTSFHVPGNLRSYRPSKTFSYFPNSFSLRIGVPLES